MRNDDTIASRGRLLLLWALMAAALPLAAQQATETPATQPPQATPTTPPAASEQGQGQDPSAPPTAPAPTQQDAAQAELRRLDRDGNGTVSANEHARDAKDRFDAMDADHNYHVDADEMQGGAPAGAGASVLEQISGSDRIAPMDANKNGELSNEESEDNADAQFRARDANGDGSLSLEELQGAQP